MAEMTETSFYASVDASVLKRASRMFDGTLDSVFCELLQNARRAGADLISFDLSAESESTTFVIMTDRGRGISDFRNLFSCGLSDWDQSVRDAEDPAGMGFFVLSPLPVTIQSLGRRVDVGASEWTGQAPVRVISDGNEICGTRICFRMEHPQQSVRDTIENLSQFGSVAVFINGEPVKRRSLLSDQNDIQLLRSLPEFGVTVAASDRQPLGRSRYGKSVWCNFYGKIVSFSSPCDRNFLVEFTGEPTPLRLVLPSRSSFIENEAFKRFCVELERIHYGLFRYTPHTLQYRHWMRARELGIELDQGCPDWSVLSLSSQYVHNVRDDKPKYRSDVDVFDVAFLGSVDSVDTPFVPVHCGGYYAGYDWYDSTPRIEEYSVAFEPLIVDGFDSDFDITLARSITATVKCSDGKVFEFPTLAASMAAVKDEDPYDCFGIVVAESGLRLIQNAALFELYGRVPDGEDESYENDLGDFTDSLLRLSHLLDNNVTRYFYDHFCEVLRGRIPAVSQHLLKTSRIELAVDKHLRLYDSDGELIFSMDDEQGA